MWAYKRDITLITSSLLRPLAIGVFGYPCTQMDLPLPLLVFLFVLTYGLVLEPGRPAALPKCFLASLSLEALRSRVLVPIIKELINQHYNNNKLYLKKKTYQLEWSWSIDRVWGTFLRLWQFLLWQSQWIWGRQWSFLEHQEVYCHRWQSQQQPQFCL